jgi:hypothetical protein
MIRLIGILTGSALAVTAIFVTFGLPELTGGSTQTPVVTPPTATPLVEAPLPDIEPDPIAEISVPPKSQMTAATAPDAPADSDFAAADAVTIEPDDPVDSVDEPALTSVPAPVTAVQPQNWYAFWSPFRSELAADGFIAELARTTGLDYRVVKLKPGVYEVAFSFSDPIDRQDKLERISAATGLDMSGG